MSNTAVETPANPKHSPKPQTFAQKPTPRTAPPRRWRPSRSRAVHRVRRTCRSKFSICGVCHSDLHQVRNEWKAVMPRSIPACPATKSSAAS